MRVIDAHVHIVSSDRERYPQSEPWIPRKPEHAWWYRDQPFTGSQLERAMDEAKVDGAVVVQPFSIYGYDNSYATDEARLLAGRLTSVCCVDPVAEDASDRLITWVARGAQGCRIFSLATPQVPVDGARADALWRCCARLRIPVSILIEVEQLPNLERQLSKFPSQRVVVDHMAHVERFGLKSSTGHAILRLAEHENCYMKYSSSNVVELERRGESVSDFVLRVVDAFGARRVLWGSNYPATTGYSYAQLVAMALDSVASLGSVEQRSVMADTALSLWPVADLNASSVTVRSDRD
jgi:L-fuconolactonase